MDNEIALKKVTTDNVKGVSLIDLAHRLNYIMKTQQNLEIEYNIIVYELWERIPDLKNDCNIQPKTMKKAFVPNNGGKNEL